MFMSKSPRLSKINRLERKITGYKISRFRLVTADGSSANPTSRMIGSGYDLITETLLYSTGAPLATTNGGYPGQVNKFKILMFVPTWPGSKLTSFVDPTKTFGQGSYAGTTFTPSWGLEFPNASQTFANLPYNSQAVANVKGFNQYSEATIGSTQLVNHDRIKVFSTRIDYMFRNLNPYHKYDVHIFDVIMRTDEYFDFDGACKTMTNPTTFLEDLMTTNPVTNTDAENIIRNRYSMQIVDMIRKGRLPPKIFKVLSHKKITLGRAKPAGIGFTNVSGTTIVSGNTTDKITSADKKWSKRYGLKTYYKGPCDAETSFANDDLITDHKLKTVHTLICTLMNNGDMVTSHASQSATTTSLSAVAYEIKKTLTWKIKSL